MYYLEKSHVFLYNNSNSNLINDLPFFSFRNHFFNNSFEKVNINSSFLGVTLGLDLRIEAPLYYLHLKQNLINFCSQVIGFGIKSLITHNILSNNFFEFISFLEGKSYICNFLNNHKETTFFIQILCF